VKNLAYYVKSAGESARDAVQFVTLFSGKGDYVLAAEEAAEIEYYQHGGFEWMEGEPIIITLLDEGAEVGDFVVEIADTIVFTAEEVRFG